MNLRPIILSILFECRDRAMPERTLWNYTLAREPKATHGDFARELRDMDSLCWLASARDEVLQQTCWTLTTTGKAAAQPYA